MNHHAKNREAGSILVNILLVMIFFLTILFGVLSLSNSTLVRSRARVMQLQAQYAAESGADSAIAYLNNGSESYAGTTSDVTLLTSTQYKATYEVSVAAGSNSKQKVITAVGKVYAPASSSTPRYTRKVRVTAERTSATSASSMVSRNIIEASSAVKTIQGKDVYVNGFIKLNKDTTHFIAENITVAGKNTGALNCSIGGSGGQLDKPLTFSTPGQTKTNITMAYNNCLTPPGNTSNSDFNIAANQSNIGTIQSLYIPWSQYMDSSYGNASSCNSWTTGASPRNIPNVAGSKNTHYPDSGSNISTSCGSSGDLALGSNQYNIKDNVHIRASLCAASACQPTFYNPDSSLKFVFVEGTINFDSITSASGSGPIVFVAYGTDPASKAGDCPYGGSVYLGNGGTTSAPAVYLMATNGLCIDKTKFGSSPALGGLGGKNLYVASNSGTPFDLKLDTNFPSSSIPIDLAWRATRYQRL